MTLKEVRQFVQDECRRAADDAYARYGQNIWTKQYVHYSPGHLIVLAEDDPIPSGALLAFPQHIPRNLTVDQMYGWIVDRVQRVPFLPPE